MTPETQLLQHQLPAPITSIATTQSTTSPSMSARDVCDACNCNSASNVTDHAQRISSTSKLSDYEKLGLLGCGGAAVVYLVRHRTSRHLFALKVQQIDHTTAHLTPIQAQRHAGHALDCHNHTRRTRRAFNELDLLDSLRHPLIAHLHDAFQDGANLCLVLEWYEGGTLADVCASSTGCVPEAAAAFYAAELVLALEYVHAMGVVYRDLKLENVLVGCDGHIRVTDFGVAQRGDRVDTTAPSSSVQFVSQSFVGTPACVAPEVILQTHVLTSAVDWWALGCLLYQLVYGAVPFATAAVPTDDTTAAVASQFRTILACRIAFPAMPHVSDACKDLIQQLLMRDVSQRLGYRGGAAAIQQHAFFQGVAWAKVRHADPPFVVTSSTLHVTPGVFDTRCIQRFVPHHMPADAFKALAATESMVLGASATSDWSYAHPPPQQSTAKTSSSGPDDTCNEEVDHSSVSGSVAALQQPTACCCCCLNYIPDCCCLAREHVLQHNERFVSIVPVRSFVDTLLQRVCAKRPKQSLRCTPAVIAQTPSSRTPWRKFTDAAAAFRNKHTQHKSSSNTHETTMIR